MNYVNLTVSECQDKNYTSFLKDVNPIVEWVDLKLF